MSRHRLRIVRCFTFHPTSAVRVAFIPYTSAVTRRRRPPANQKNKRGKTLFRTFVFGILLGAVLAAAAAYVVRPVDQRREASVVTVQPNGGSREAFYVDLPGDRVLAGGNGLPAAVPAGLKWPGAPILAASRAELFKLRNERGAVIGVASRIAAPTPGGARMVEWVLHLPARGTLYLLLDPVPDDAGTRAGTLRTGTREFANLHGSATEHFVPSSGAGENESGGRIELVTVRRGARGDEQ